MGLSNKTQQKGSNMDYPKIQTLFKRDEKNHIIETEYTMDEFRYLENNLWECTEKIDGTNIHVDFEVFEGGEMIVFQGRTSRAEIPKHLEEYLRQMFTSERLREAVPGFCENDFNGKLFGEGYGVKIQKGGNYMKDRVGFILFDVFINGWWLSRQDCEEIANRLSIPIVPFVGYKTIPEAIDFVRQGFTSLIAENKQYQAEGLVLKTPCGLKARNGERIITKLKHKDF